ncbi:hypothetical protein K8Q93_03315 [Candidatus Parcubacteria bacterium]|nr:hypothetical protein [Candidatus Parcubacteria bacterium]
MGLDFFYDLFFQPFSDGTFVQGLGYVVRFIPFWGPPVFGLFFWRMWIAYKRRDFIQSQKYILLEIKLPREVLRSPRAMELALTHFHNGSGESTWWDRYVNGKVRPWFSLEIASIEGNIHFYVWTRAQFKNVVEASLYSQYPGIEITEVPDYTEAFPYFDPTQMSVWICDFKMKKEDEHKHPLNSYPIKTYVDYELDKDPKEEFKIDPLTTVLEYISMIGKGEQVWMQFLIQVHAEGHVKDKFPFGDMGGQSDADMGTEGKETIKKLLDSFKPEGATFPRIPTKGEGEIIAAIERKLSKPLFDFGMRMAYMAKPENFNGGRISGYVQIMKPFYTRNMNSFAFKEDSNLNDFPWQDFQQIRANKLRKKKLAAYRTRSWFHPPYKKKAYVLSTEELATIWHFPGSVAATPGITRTMAKKMEAPDNLPR